MAASFKSLANLNAKHRAILVAMHTGRKASYDMFDFPGTGGAIFDELSSTFGAIAGNHRSGFSISKRGATWAAKHT